MRCCPTDPRRDEYVHPAASCEDWRSCRKHTPPDSSSEGHITRVLVEKCRQGRAAPVGVCVARKWWEGGDSGRGGRRPVREFPRDRRAGDPARPGPGSGSGFECTILAWLTGYERSTLGEWLAANGVPIGPDRRPTQNFFQRSDNYQFALKGIVAHTISSFNMHADYHRPTDEVSKVDPVHVSLVIDAAARAVRALADGPRPTWKPVGRPTPAPPRSSP